jgi:hypothetical protein
MEFAKLFSTPLGEWFGRARVATVLAAAKPGTGATLCCAGLRMTVQAGLTDEMWSWLSGLGWRELRRGESRLRFSPLPSTLVSRLYDVSPEDRQRVLLAAIRESSKPHVSAPRHERAPIT